MSKIHSNKTYIPVYLYDTRCRFKYFIVYGSDKFDIASLPMKKR